MRRLHHLTTAGAFCLLALAAFPQERAEVRSADERRAPLTFAVRLLDGSIPLLLDEVGDRAGVRFASARPGAGRDDRLLELDGALPDEAARDALVARLADDPRIAYASRVWMRRGDLPLYPLPTILLRFEGSLSETRQRALLEGLDGVEVVESQFAGLANAWRLESVDVTSAEVLERVRALEALPDLAWVQSNHAFLVRQSDCDPADCFFPQQWNLKNTGQAPGYVPGVDVNASNAWCVETGDPSVVVAVIDSGVQFDHPDMSVAWGLDYTDDPGANGGRPVNSCDNHGTAVGGVVAAIRDNLGYDSGTPCSSGLMVGVAPDCRIGAMRVMKAAQDTGGNCLGASWVQSDWLANGIAGAWFHGARVTVNAFGYFPSQEPGPPWDEQAVNDTYDNTQTLGIFHVSATGNNGTAAIYWPGTLFSVAAVGGMDPDGTVFDAGNVGTGIFCAAPAKDIRTLDRTGYDGFNNAVPYDWAIRSGTSYAAPHVGGIAALLYSSNLDMDSFDVTHFIYLTCRDQGAAGYDETFGFGLPDAAAALELADDKWVDGAHTGVEAGTPNRPFKTVSAGFGATPTGHVLTIKTGSYDETVVLDRAVELAVDGGPVVIGE